MKISITKKVEFATGHRLMNDPGKCHRLHGHNFEAEVTVSGTPDETGWIMPFKELKNAIWNITKEKFDHRMLLETADEEVLKAFDEANVEYLVTPIAPTTEAIAAMIFQYVQTYLKVKRFDVTVEKVRVYEDQWQYAEIHKSEKPLDSSWFRKIQSWTDTLAYNNAIDGK